MGRRPYQLVQSRQRSIVYSYLPVRYKRVPADAAVQSTSATCKSPAGIQLILTPLLSRLTSIYVGVHTTSVPCDDVQNPKDVSKRGITSQVGSCLFDSHESSRAYHTYEMTVRVHDKTILYFGSTSRLSPD
jgi:hypothetical protein